LIPFFILDFWPQSVALPYADTLNAAHREREREIEKERERERERERGALNFPDYAILALIHLANCATAATAHLLPKIHYPMPNDWSVMRSL
jgi:hypothetical protein